MCSNDGNQKQEKTLIMLLFVPTVCLLFLSCCCVLHSLHICLPQIPPPRGDQRSSTTHCVASAAKGLC